MFPLTHAMVTQSILSKSDRQVVLGSIFPDLGNAIGLNRDITHEMGTGFFGFCRDRYPEYLGFARAIITHGSNPHGLDYYADESFQGQTPGYCFQRAMPLVDKVVDACRIPSEMGLWKAHNFIEMAYELIVVEKYPSITEQVLKTLADTKNISLCSEVLGGYFNMDTSKIGVTISNMPVYFCLSEVTPLHLAQKYALQLRKRHDVREANPQIMAGVIEEAKVMVAPEFENFINFSLKKIKKLLKMY